MSNKKLFLFTIGPVKSFINDSRKTQDLFGGSALLSRLTHEAIKEAQNQFGNNNFNLITPVYDINSFNTNKQGIPNRFLAEIEIDANDIKTRAEAIKKAVIEYFKKMDNHLLNNQAKKQLQNALDIYWVAIDRTNDYKTDFIRINMELAAAKNYKEPVQLNEKGRKCIVDGKRNVVYYRKNKADEKYQDNEKLCKKKLFQPQTNVKIYEENNEDELKIWQLQEGEGISAVTLRKRLHLNNPHNFPSTASVALMDLFEEMKKNPDFMEYKEKVNGKGEKFLKHSDDQLFYYENIEPICKEYGKTDEEIKNCQEMHQKWAKNKNFTKYYALVRFDGDNMGDWFTGVHFKDDINLLEAQQALSTALGNFSIAIHKEIKAPEGKVIYAGGEDFMAFVNIHHLDKALNNILETFDEKVNKDTDLIKYKKPDAINITLSIGIAIAHYKQPLSMVLQKAQAMEKVVKENGRNGFAVGIIKHSGSVLEYRYKTEKYTVKALEHIQKIIDLLKEDEQQQDKYFSPAFITNIYGAFEKYGFDLSKKLIESKIDLYTAQAYNGNKDKKEEKIKELREILKDLLAISITHKNFGNTLLAIDFMYRKTK